MLNAFKLAKAIRFSSAISLKEKYYEYEYHTHTPRDTTRVVPITIQVKWRTASGTWFGETSRQGQAEPVKQQQTGISPNHIPEAVPYWVVCTCLKIKIASRDHFGDHFGDHFFPSESGSRDARKFQFSAII